MMKKLAILLMVVFCLSVACATTPVVTVAPLVITPIPKEVKPTDVPLPVPGSRFVFQETNLENNIVNRIYNWVISEGLYKEKPVIIVEETDGYKRESYMEVYYIVYDLSYRWLTTILNGKEIYSATPYREKYSWPLTVGKEWKSEYDSIDLRTKNSKTPIEESYKVESYEKLSVKAGKFEVYKIKMESRLWEPDTISTETFYFSSSLGIPVKKDITLIFPTSQIRRRWSIELVEYNAPQ